MSKKKKQQEPLPLRVIAWTFPKVQTISPWLAKRWFIELFFSPVKFKTPPAEKEVMEKAEMMKFEYQNQSIQTYKWGEGKPVLFVHGWMGRGTQFRKFIPTFNQSGYQVIAFDATAHGLSEGSKTNILDFTNIIHQLARKYDFEAVIGHSIGGAAALRALHKNKFAKKLIMIGSPTETDNIIGPFLEKLNASKAIRQHLLDYIFERFGVAFDELTVKHVIKDFRDIDLLLVHDEEDYEVTLENTQVILENYSSAQLYKTQGLGHTRILKDEEVIKKCLEFIKINKNKLTVTSA